ncbi:MAG: hypothetical protein KY476_06340 [Planctomycetes bacterium]|nr:hypothetical protein [Planctomycetota bacterium]
MAQIIDCLCGAKVRLPAEGANRRFRCPKCKAAVALTVDACVLTVGRTAPGEAATCPICQSNIAPDEAAVTCPACDQVHHNECWAEIGGCGTYGCSQAPALEKDDPGGPALSAWGDTKSCPVCGETIKAIALRCRYCQAEFDTVDPLTARDLRRKSRRKSEEQSLKRWVAVLFGLSAVGLLAPILVFVAPAVVLPRRERLKKTGPLYLVLGYAAIGLSVFYALLMLAAVASQ